MNKKEILLHIKNALLNPIKGRNSMGCAEANYSPYYAIGNVFTKKELKEMTYIELCNLRKLAEYLSDAFY